MKGDPGWRAHSFSDQDHGGVQHIDIGISQAENKQRVQDWSELDIAPQSYCQEVLILTQVGHQYLGAPQFRLHHCPQRRVQQGMGQPWGGVFEQNCIHWWSRVSSTHGLNWRTVSDWQVCCHSCPKCSWSKPNNIQGSVLQRHCCSICSPSQGLKEEKGGRLIEDYPREQSWPRWNKGLSLPGVCAAVAGWNGQAWHERIWLGHG